MELPTSRIEFFVSAAASAGFASAFDVACSNNGRAVYVLLLLLLLL
jgi:hypothetical protein